MNDDNLRNAAQQYFNKHDDDISDEELARLSDARELALSTRTDATSRFVWPLVFASLFSVFTISALWTNSISGFNVDDTSASVEVKETIIDSDIDPDVLADYEFYEWISEQELDAG